MGRKGSKHASVVTLSGGIPSGVDYSSAPTAVPAGYAMDMRNMVYLDQGTAPVTRPGTTSVVFDGYEEGDQIDALYVWEKDASTSYVVVAQGGTLSYLDDGALVTIGTLTTGVVPCFANFNQRLIIADNAAGGLRYWDGTDYDFLDDSPTHPTVCISHASRLWCNSMASGNTDLVYASAAEDEEEWAISYGAESIPTEYGTGLWVAALESFGSDLVVFKYGTAGGRQVFRINTAGDSDTWSGVLVSNRAGAVNHASVATIGTDVMFADSDGIKLLSGTDAYGDFSVNSAIGLRIMPNLGGAVRSMTQFSPWAGLLMLVTGSPTAYVFFPHNGAWCPVSFACGTITAACSDSTDIYLGDADGRIWKIADIPTDGYITGALAVGAADIASHIQTPLKADSHGMILRRADVLMDILAAGAGTVSVVGSDLVNAVQIAEWASGELDPLIYGNQDYIFGNNDLIFSTTEAHVRSFSRYRARSISMKIAANSGRFRVNQINFEVAQVAA